MLSELLEYLPWENKDAETGKGQRSLISKENQAFLCDKYSKL
jgi:hypothetical protein